MEEIANTERKQSSAWTNIAILLREFSFVVIVQTLLFTLFWNMTVIGIFQTKDYTISILTGFYAILAFKAFTFSYLLLLIRSNSLMIQDQISTEIYVRRMKDEMLASYMVNLAQEKQETSENLTSNKE
jgi:hypothetical protein